MDYFEVTALNYTQLVTSFRIAVLNRELDTADKLESEIMHRLSRSSGADGLPLDR